MPNSFYYAAYSYLDEWMGNDSRFHNVLAYEKRNEISEEGGRKLLVEVATYYSVARTLRDTGEDRRLLAAYQTLAETEPPTMEDVVEKVTLFAETLHQRYGPKTPLSAASKFLWMRFRSPVVIYDSKASGWLWNRCLKSEGYSAYHEAWLTEYKEHEGRIREACSELKYFKKFTLADQMLDEKFSDLIGSQWFAERVFDHFMLNDESQKTKATEAKP